MPANRYCHIARWNGPNGSYWNFETGSSAGYLKDGDVIKATAAGANPTIITLYVNGVQILQAVDTGAAGGGNGAYGPWTSGNPGIGFFDNADNDWKSFGLSSFSVTDEQPKQTRRSSAVNQKETSPGDTAFPSRTKQGSEPGHWSEPLPWFFYPLANPQS
jgi:hypothetical protein